MTARCVHSSSFQAHLWRDGTVDFHFQRVTPLGYPLWLSGIAMADGIVLTPGTEKLVTPEAATAFRFSSGARIRKPAAG